MNLVFNWAVMVSSNRVGLCVAKIRNTPYFLPSWDISFNMDLDGELYPFGAKLWASSVTTIKGGSILLLYFYIKSLYNPFFYGKDCLIGRY